MKRLIVILSLLPVLILLLTSCSINKLAVNKVAEMLSSDRSTVFTGDEDLELIRDALPFALKLYESLLEQAPDNPELLMATGRAFCLYAYAFVQEPADRLAETEVETQVKMDKRAKKLFLRSRGYLLRAMEIRHTGFTNMLFSGRTEEALKNCTKEDVPYLYWSGMAWMAAFSADKFDMNLAVNTSKPISMLQRALDLDEAYDEGALHEFFITYYGSLPKSMGGSEEKAREHFKKAVALSQGLKAGPYVALATSVSVNKQDIEEFKTLLDQALSVDLDKKPGNRLMNIFNQDKARWLLDHLDRYFLIEKSD